MLFKNVKQYNKYAVAIIWIIGWLSRGCLALPNSAYCTILSYLFLAMTTVEPGKYPTGVVANNVTSVAVPTGIHTSVGRISSAMVVAT